MKIDGGNFWGQNSGKVALEVVQSNYKLKVGNPPQRSGSQTIPPTDLF